MALLIAAQLIGMLPIVVLPIEVRRVVRLSEARRHCGDRRADPPT